MLETLLQFCYHFYENFRSSFPVCMETLGPLDTYGLMVNDQPRYSARITSHVQNKETATHERNTELTCVRGCDVTKNHKVRIDYGRNGQGSSWP